MNLPTRRRLVHRRPIRPRDLGRPTPDRVSSQREAAPHAEESKRGCGRLAGRGEDHGTLDDPPRQQGLGPATLDLGGRTITCNGSSGIEVTGRGAKVKNGTLLRCRHGVELFGRDHRISDLEIDLARDTGLSFTGSVTGTRVENIDVDRPGTVAGAVGIGVLLGNDDERNTLRNVRVFNPALDGFRIRGKRQRVEDCLAMFHARAGYDIAGERHVIVDSAALQNKPGGADAADGFHVFGARDLVLSRNEAVQNNAVGFRILTTVDARLDRNVARRNDGDGFFVSNVDDVDLKRNLAEENGGDGIVVDANVHDVLISDNEARKHAAPRFDLRDQDPACGNTRWQKNELARAFPACVE